MEDIDSIHVHGTLWIWQSKHAVVNLIPGYHWGFIHVCVCMALETSQIQYLNSRTAQFFSSFFFCRRLPHFKKHRVQKGTSTALVWDSPQADPPAASGAHWSQDQQVIISPLFISGILHGSCQCVCKQRFESAHQWLFMGHICCITFFNLLVPSCTVM